MDQIKTPISQEQFDEVINQISTSEYGISKICKSIGISKQSFYDYKRIIGETAEDRYARAKVAQIDVIQDRIEELQDECKDTILSMDKDDKRCNAIQSAYREQIRHLEWLSARLRSDKYGDKIDVTSNGESIARELTVTPISTKVNDKSQST